MRKYCKFINFTILIIIEFIILIRPGDKFINYSFRLQLLFIFEMRISL